MREVEESDNDRTYIKRLYQSVEILLKYRKEIN